MIEKRPHILCLSETHITSDILENEIQIDEYNTVRCDSNSRHTGGVILYIREGIKFKKIATVSYDKTWFATISIEDANLQFVRNIDARVRNMRFANNLVIPNYFKKRAQKSFVFVAAREYNLITKFMHDNKLNYNNYINNVIKFYTK